ncbi:fimbrial biogenesis chaperone [Henriciella litoralis]|uniref:hypothetical protein n=1 Tax=Henriciella litoralis TaxID=568102 RepID=UPI000A033DCF|nr:hypothetical protein [Henriciella litoralis]
MTLKMTCRRCFFAFAAAIAVALPVQAFGIGLQPTTVEMDAEPGTRQRQVMTIANTHPEDTISLTLGLADWSLDRNGQINLQPPGERSDSAAEWVRFSPSFVTLKPGQSQQIIVDIITPESLERSGDHRFALLASAILPETRGGQSGVWRKHDIASLFYLTTDPATSDPAVRDARLSIGADGTQEVDLLVENTGTAHARLEGTVTISGEGDDISIPIANLVVLNGGSREFTAPIPEDLPSNPQVTVDFENVFAPQNPSKSARVKTYSAPLILRDAVLDAGEAITTDQ